MNNFNDVVPISLRIWRIRALCGVKSVFNSGLFILGLFILGLFICPTFGVQNNIKTNYNIGKVTKMRQQMIPMLGITGYSGSGKTTLLEKLVPLLIERGA